MDPSLEIEVRRRADRTTVSLRGELSVDSSPRLWRLLDGLEPAGEVVLDLADLTFVDSAGLGCLMKLARLAADAGATLIATDASTAVRRTIEVAGLHRAIAILPSAELG